MKFGVIGLGQMGGGVALQAMERGHRVIGYNRSPQPTQSLAKEGLEPVFSLDELVRRLAAPRVIFIYVPHGEPMTKTLTELKGLLERGDLVANGGNSHWAEIRTGRIRCATTRS